MYVFAIMSMGLGHSARKSCKTRKSCRSRKSRKSFRGYHLNHDNSRKSRKLCLLCMFTFSAVRFLLLRKWWVHMLVLSFFLPFFLHCMLPALPFFSLVSKLVVACRTIHFLFAFQPPSVDATAPGKHAVSFVTSGSNFKPQTTASTDCFFSSKKRCTIESRSTKETWRTSICIFSPSPGHAYFSNQTPHVNHVKPRKTGKSR